MLTIFHDSHQRFFRSPFGAVVCDESIVIRVVITNPTPVSRVVLWLSGIDGDTHVPMKPVAFTSRGYLYETTITAPSLPSLCWYRFVVESGGKTSYYNNNSKKSGGVGEKSHTAGFPYQITVYKQDYPVPSWMREAVVYQIFVDRFYRPTTILPKSGTRYLHENWDNQPLFDHRDDRGAIVRDDFFGGNLYGVIDKLDFLSELGVNTLYLNPIFDAASNHKYDTGDYENVDPMFGDNDAFISLASTAKEKGIRLILDGVFSHTGSDSRYFNKQGSYQGVGAYQDKSSPYSSWYNFVDFPDEYDSWWGIDTLPNVNELDHNYLDYIVRNDDSIIKRWLAMGASGWRLDVADELPELFLKELYKAVKETSPDHTVLGEVWEDASNKTSYGQLREYLLGEDMDSVMNYPFRTGILDFLTEKSTAFALGEVLLTLSENYPKPVFYSLLNGIGSHDVPRALTVLSGAPFHKELSPEDQSRYTISPEGMILGKTRLKLASLLQMTLPGMPHIYYGDEAGMSGMGDPFNRGTYPWGKEDAHLLEWYREIITLRKEHPCLTVGEVTLIPTNPQVFTFVRALENHMDVFGQPAENALAFIGVNASNQWQDLVVNLGQYDVSQLIHWNGSTILEGNNNVFHIPIEPLGWKVFFSVDKDLGRCPNPQFF